MPLRRAIFSCLLSLAFAADAIGQTAPAQPTQSGSTASQNQDPERQHAIELFNAGKFVDAMPLFEKLAADHPDDATIKANWAFAISGYAATLNDPELRKKARIRARSIALQAQKQGNNSAMVQVVLQIPEDGSEPTFSEHKDADEAMRSAEADFARGDYDKARQGYLRALLLDPKNYAAALFIGDVYFKQKVWGSAGEWFAKAIEIDPNRETAYRYWGDALAQLGNSAAAREKYINAVIADPYDRTSWAGLTNWAQISKLPLNWIRLQDRIKLDESDPAHINIDVDPSFEKGSANQLAWTAYGMTRATWRAAFSKRFPKEPKYRRTMQEEFESLTVMIKVLKDEQDQSKLKDLDPSIQSVMKIQEAGFLEPFALLNRADKEIARDYEPYRATHRDTIYRYFDEFVVPKAPPQ